MGYTLPRRTNSQRARADAVRHGRIHVDDRIEHSYRSGGLGENP